MKNLFYQNLMIKTNKNQSFFPEYSSEEESKGSYNDFSENNYSSWSSSHETSSDESLPDNNERNFTEESENIEHWGECEEDHQLDFVSPKFSLKPGLTQDLSALSGPIDYFQLFLSQTILEDICRFTIYQVKQKEKKFEEKEIRIRGNGKVLIFLL